MSYNNSYASSVKASDGTYYTYSDVFSETMYDGELKNCGYSCAVKCSCNKWSSSSSGMIRPISATSGYYSDNGGTVTCYKDLGCPDGYYEDKPSSVFTYTTTASSKCYKATGCASGYTTSTTPNLADSYHGFKCYTESFYLYVGPVASYDGTIWLDREVVYNGAEKSAPGGTCTITMKYTVVVNGRKSGETVEVTVGNQKYTETVKTDGSGVSGASKIDIDCDGILGTKTGDKIERCEAISIDDLSATCTSNKITVVTDY